MTTRTSLRQLSLCALFGLTAYLARPGMLAASDHGDTPLLINANRRDALITDLHVFIRDGRLVLAGCFDPAIPPSATGYTFASDLIVKFNINKSVPVSFDDAEDLATYGGTILDPVRVKADIVFTITFANPAAPLLKTSGVPLNRLGEIRFFTGLRDDPFIRGPRQGRNSAAIVIDLPLDMVVLNPSQATLLVWLTSRVPDLPGPFQDAAARSLRSMFPENDAMNTLEPWQHWTVLGVQPDVVILDTTRPVAYPNGRELADDVVDLVGDPRVLMNDAPFPAANDLPFLEEFPYLAPPHAPPPPADPAPGGIGGPGAPRLIPMDVTGEIQQHDVPDR